MDLENVEQLAQGRVWSGTRAFQNGLVDGLGDLQTAIAMAAEAASLDSYNVVSYPNITPDLETLLSEGFPLLQLHWTSQLPSFWQRLFVSKTKSQRPIQIQTELPFELNIR